MFRSRGRNKHTRSPDRTYGRLPPIARGVYWQRGTAELAGYGEAAVSASSARSAVLLAPLTTLASIALHSRTVRSAKLSGVRIGDHVTIIDNDGSETRGRVASVWPDHCGLICSETRRRLKATDSNTIRVERRDDTAGEAREKMSSIPIGAPAVLMPRSHQRRRSR